MAGPTHVEGKGASHPGHRAARGAAILHKPSPLTPGDRIAIVATSSPFEADHLEQGLAWLRAQGYEPVVAAHAFARRRYLAGTDAERAADLQAALTDPSIRGVVCARGGYGASRLLGLLDASAIRPHCKIFCGFSDVTTLHLWLQARCGWVTFHGPMVGTRWAGEGFDPDTARSFLDTLRGHPPCIEGPLTHTLRGGTARGRLVGGNLTLLCHSIGTPWEIDTREAILLVEDVHEVPYRIDRMLTHLRHAGKLNTVRGLVVGELDGCHAPSGADYSLDEVLADCLGDLPIPVVTQFPISHAKPNFTVALGIEYDLDANSRRLSPAESAFT